MPVQIKSPNPDEIWERWKQKANRTQKLEKYYKVKGAVFNLDNITAAEFVKEVHKGAILYYEESHDIQPSNKKIETETVVVPKLEKITFYKFSSKVDKENWKGNDEVPTYNSLSGITCSSCGGSGGIKCKKCNGTKFVECPSCKGKKENLKCKACNGTGNQTIEVEVQDEKGKTITKQSQVQCKKCFGSGYYACMKCGGSGKIPCTYCDGMGMNTCTDCKGYGTLYKYKIEPVPFKEVHDSTPIIESSFKLSGFEKEIGKDMHDTIEEVEGIPLKNPRKQMGSDFIEPTLGYYDKDIKKLMKKTYKTWKKAEKDDEQNIRLPIYLFPAIALDCETRKGKSFQVYCVGSDKKFKVYGRI